MLSLNTRRWIVLVFTLLGLGITLRAGFWQLQREHDKLNAQQRLDESAARPAWQNAQLLAHAPNQAVPDAARWRDQPVVLTGTWRAEQTVLLDNRSMGGRAGFYVVTPLALAHSTGPVYIWVQRGWVARDVHDRTRVPSFATPTQIVVLEGRLALGLSERFVLGEEGSGTIRQNLDLAQMQTLTDQRSLNLVVVQTDAPEGGLLRNWPSPDSGVDKHRGYAFQWFGMAGLMVVLYVWFQIVPVLRRR